MGTLIFFYSLDGSTNSSITASYTLPLNTWVHIAVDRNLFGVTRIYANGVVIASGTNTAALFASTEPLRIGNDPTTARRFPGQIDDLRITKGAARYEGAFTPPAVVFPDGDHFSDFRACGLARETIGASDGVVYARGLVRESVVVGAAPLHQVLVSGLVREAVYSLPVVSTARQYAVTVIG